MPLALLRLKHRRPILIVSEGKRDMPFYSSKIALHIVPWHSVSEWKRVKDLFFSNDDASSSMDEQETLDSIRTGIKHIKMWRVRGKLPISVEATSAFFEIYLLDKQATVDDHELRMMISMAMIRFVNGLADQQQKGAFAMSIMHLAKNIDLPRYFVDIRHSATHDHLPSLSLLRKAYSDALSWLKEHYWDAHAEFTTEVRQQLVSLLGQYQRSRKQQIKDCSPDELEGLALSTELMTLVRDISSCCPDDLIQELISLLMEAGNLVPLNKKKRPNFETGISPQLLALWSPLLTSFSNTYVYFYEDLLESFAQKLSQIESDASFSKSHEIGLAVWAKHIIQELCPAMSELKFSEVSKILLRFMSTHTPLLGAALIAGAERHTNVDGFRALLEMSAKLTCAAPPQVLEVQAEAEDTCVESILQESEDMLARFQQQVARRAQQSKVKVRAAPASATGGIWSISDNPIWSTERPIGYRI